MHAASTTRKAGTPRRRPYRPCLPAAARERLTQVNACSAAGYNLDIVSVCLGGYLRAARNFVRIAQTEDEGACWSSAEPDPGARRAFSRQETRNEQTRYLADDRTAAGHAARGDRAGRPCQPSPAGRPGRSTARRAGQGRRHGDDEDGPADGKDARSDEAHPHEPGSAGAP